MIRVASQSQATLRYYSVASNSPACRTQNTLPDSTNCLACSEDGRYLILGHFQGFSLWCASSLICLAEWLLDRVEIASIQMTKLAETTYLLGTVDDMGVARVFAYHSEAIHLLSVINVMENISKRSICLAFEVSKGGDYGAASISCTGALCLEVYHFPAEAWLKELEKNSDSSGEVDVKWSPAALLMKIKPVNLPTGGPVDGPSDVLQATDFLTHCLALDIHSTSLKEVEHTFNANAGKTNESPRRCTLHFLLPCGQFPGKAESQTAGLPVGICVWWSGSHNLLQYLLQKAYKQDVEPMPDMLWPNAKEIICSSVSRCTRYIALGLDDGLVCVWDRQSVSPLSVVSVSAPDSTLLRIQFMDCWPASADHSQTSTAAKIHLLVSCKTGAIHKITTGRGLQSCTVQLTERPEHIRHLPTVTTLVPFLQNLSLVIQRNGEVLLQNATNHSPVCFLTPPTSHLIATPCNPVYALNNKEHTLFIKGDEYPSRSVSSKGESQNQLFIFRFGECDAIKKYIVSLPDSEPKHKTLSHDTLEENWDLYLQQRVLSMDERSKAIRQTWKQLEETAAMVQQKHNRAAVS